LLALQAANAVNAVQGCANAAQFGGKENTVFPASQNFPWA